VPQNVPWHCELEMVDLALQQAMQEDPFGLGRERKVCKCIDEICSLLGLLLHEGSDILCGADGRTACNDSMHGGSQMCVSHARFRCEFHARYVRPC
jgi:hypothetical protein